MRPDPDDVHAVFSSLCNDYADLGRSDIQSNDEIFTAIHVPPFSAKAR
jgi:hypothetical protein